MHYEILHMKVLMVHNRYVHPGGEDLVFRNEVALLRSRGHEVVEWTETNVDLGDQNLRSPQDFFWSRRSFDKGKRLAEKHRPDVAHFHNIFFRVTPSVYTAVTSAGVPVVQTLHNYRLSCPKATFYRGGHPCEDCIAKTIKWPSVLHSCYRESRIESIGIASILAYHWTQRTWNEQVDRYIALTQFMKNKMVEAGLNEEPIHVKPNFLSEDPGPDHDSGHFFLFSGRLSEGKGVQTLLDAWSSTSNIELVVAGDGEGSSDVTDWLLAHPNSSVRWIGWRPRSEILDLMRGARAFIFPSESYEGFPMGILEAMAFGKPTIASDLGAMRELIEDGRTGLLFRPGDPEDLAAKVRWASDHPQEMADMGREARREYERKYTAERNYEMLMDIYRRAIEDNEAR